MKYAICAAEKSYLNCFCPNTSQTRLNLCTYLVLSFNSMRVTTAIYLNLAKPKCLGSKDSPANQKP